LEKFSKENVGNVSYVLKKIESYNLSLYDLKLFPNVLDMQNAHKLKYITLKVPSFYL
jgi:hypothetical protein